MRGVVALLVAGFLFVSISVLYPSVRSEETVGSTLYVGGIGPGNYTAIQDAINAANDGYKIYVYSGTYEENIVITKTITLTGADKSTTIINGTHDGSVLYVSGIYVNISGFTIQNSGDSASGVRLYFSRNSVTNNIIRNNAVGIAIGDISTEYGNNIIFGNTIIDNDNAGIYIVSSSNNTISQNNIDNNKVGIKMVKSASNTIHNNTIVNNNVTGIDILTFSENNTIYHNNFINNTQDAQDAENNTWYNATLQEGNYWYNYTLDDKNNDGIGDTPYEIPGDTPIDIPYGDGNYHQDKYPLMMPYDGTIRYKEFYVDRGSVITMLIIGMIVVIIFLLPIAYVWYKKGWR
jgi:parallel beta-helix repeat protein